MPPIPDTKDGLLDNLEGLYAASKAPAAPPTPPPAEPPKADAPPAAPAPDPEDDIPSDLSDKGKAGWKQLRENHKKAKKEAEDLQKKLTDLEAKLATAKPEDIKPLLDKITDLENRLSVAALEHDPRFQNYYGTQQSIIIEQAKNIGGDKLAAALQVNNPALRKQALAEAYAELDAVDQSTAGALINQFDQLNKSRNNELSNARTRMQQLREAEEASRKEAQEHEFAILNETLSRWSDPEKGNPAFIESKEDQEWNKAVAARREQARAIFSGQIDASERAKVAAWAVSTPALAQALTAREKRIKELEAQVADLIGAKPGISSQGAKSGDSAPGPDVGMIDAALNAWGGGR